MTRNEEYRNIAYTVRGNCADDRKSQQWYDERSYWTAIAILSGGEWAHNLNHAKIETSILDNITLDVNSLELLVGRPTDKFIVNTDIQSVIDEGKRIRKIMGPSGGWESNATGHRAPDWIKLLSLGTTGIIKEIDKYISELDENSADYCEKFAFYSASKISLEAFARFAGRWEEYVRGVAAETADSVRKAELLKIADNLSGAPRYPAKHFYEALQAVWLMQYALQCCENDTGLCGRPDHYLYPYYKADLESGEIDADFAFELIEQLYYKHNEVYGSWPASIMVCGEDADGNRICNELSYMCIRALKTTGMVNPSVNVCYTDDLPDDFIDLCIENIAGGCTRPAFFNDRIIQKGLRDAGMDERHARYYINSTCVEITPIGASNVHVATPYINLNKSVEYILGGGRQLFGDKCGVARDIHFSENDLLSFDGFYSVIKKVISEIIRARLEPVVRSMYSRAHYASSPLASTLIDDCLARGMDSGSGGALYSYVYPCFPGFINLIDNIAAIRKAVYEDKKITLSELAELCRTNYFNEEKLRLYLLNICPKFGNNIDSVDKIGIDLYELIQNELSKYHTSLGGTFHPSYFAWIMHGNFGRVTSATPDGRFQGEALSESLAAAQGRDKNGPLAVVDSISKLDQSLSIGGIASNFRFSKRMLSSAEGKAMLKSFIRLCMYKDCFEVQFNAVDQQDLINAQKNPEEYRTLLVRVAGYSDYFVTLSTEIQNEIIKRTEFDEA